MTNQPDVKETIGGWQFEWVKEKLKVKVSRIQSHSDGRVTGDLSFTDLQDKRYRPLTANFNFTSDITRSKLVKEIDGLGNLDWSELMEHVCIITVDKAREGEPVIELSTEDEVKPPTYLVYPFVMANQVNLLFGPPESGKTQVAMVLSLMMMLPWTDNPLGLKVPEKAMNVLWLDYEADRDTAQWNFKRIVEGAGAGFVTLPYRRCRHPLYEDAEQLVKQIQDRNINCVVVDSVGKAAGGDLDKSESPVRFFTGLDCLKCTSIVLAHTPKGGNEIYGSTFFKAYARSIWEVKGSPDGEQMHVGLWDNKANFRGKLPPQAMLLKYDDTHIYLETEDVKTVSGFLEHISVSMRIQDVLSSHGMMSPKEIQSEMPDVKIATIYVELARLTHDNKVLKMKEGNDTKYGLIRKEGV